MAYSDELAEVYDLIYQDKDYQAECDFLESLFKKYSHIEVKSILDIACGTGNHCIELTKRGYVLTGNDISSDMIRLARTKVDSEGLETHFTNYPMEDFSSDQQYDAIICMFSSINYLTEDIQLRKLFHVVAHHLRRGGLFIFDFWNGSAVLRILPSTRIKVVEDRGKKIIRIAQPELDVSNDICRVHYNFLVIQNNNILNEIEETHTIRYLFPREITSRLKDAGFEVLRICSFLDLDGRPDENAWNIVAIAKAVKTGRLYR